MKTKIFIALLFIVLVAGGAAFFLFFQQSTSENPNPNGNSSVTGEGSGTVSPSTSTPPVPKPSPTVMGETRKKIDSLIEQSTPLQSPGIYQVDQYPKTDAPSVVPDYETTYFKDNDTFVIMLYRYPLMETRQKAQESLMGKLALSKEEACALNIEVRVNAGVNVELAGQDLGISFCPGSIDLSGVENK